jgi:uncharacterized protein YciI
VLTDERRAELRAEAEPLRAGAFRKRFFVLLWTDRPDQTDDAYLEVLPEHLRYLRKMEEDGVLFGSGPFDPPDGVPETYESMSILRADSHAHARTIADAMPMARHCLRTYELFSWDSRVGSLTIRVELNSGTITLE